MENWYQKELKTKEWRKKTIEILKRDNYTCQRCGTTRSQQLTTHRSLLLDKILQQSHISQEYGTHDRRNIRIKIGSKHSGFMLKSPHPLEDLKGEDNLVFLYQTVRKNWRNYPYQATLGRNNFDETIHRQIINDPVVKIIRSELKDKPTIDVDLEGIYILHKDHCKESLFSKNSQLLEIHHKCYRKGIEIWEHSNEEYVTLCNVCHDIVHENQRIPIYDEVGREIENLELCTRCNGKGYLPEYRHVENGVCFKCGGWGSFINY